VKFKNDLERRIFEIALRVCGPLAKVKHNEILRIDRANSPEVASFVGPPKKEIDVITAGFAHSPDVKVLISCKDYQTSKAEPADVQEWAAVVKTMNLYSAGTKYVGLVISPGGFTGGCEPWATSYNLGVIPPSKGKALKFTAETCDQMFERVLSAFDRRLHFPHAALFEAPLFYDFVYHLTEAFEGRDNSAKEFGERYRLLGTNWLSSFHELVKTLKGRTLLQIRPTSTGINLTFSGGMAFRMRGREITFGAEDGQIEGEGIVVVWEKNFHGEACTPELVRQLVAGQSVTSAGDWGDRFEFGLSDDLMLAVEPDRIQVYRTRNPVDQNLL
jgi:hypothetical protein